jgi:hypothetical protein
MVILRIRPALLLFAFSLLLDVQPATGQALDESFRLDIEKLLEVTNSSQIGVQTARLMSEQILAGLKNSRPDIPDRVIEIAKEVLDSELSKMFAGPDGLQARIVSIYGKHFTHEDVRGLLAFYSTDLGKKAIGVMPVVVQEAAAAGQQWAQQHLPGIKSALESRLRSEGLFVK